MAVISKELLQDSSFGTKVDHVLRGWFALYTSANRERCVAQQLEEREIESFVPTYESARRWKDRRVVLSLPLFPGYVFVRMAPGERLRALQVPGVVRLVSFNGMPAEVPEDEITALRVSLAKGARAEPHPFLAVGARVEIKNGTLAGIKGILVRRKGRSRIVISIEALQKSVAVEIIDTDLVPLN